MASSAKDIQLRELKDTISQLNTIMSEQTELIRSLRTIIEEKTAHEMVLQEQVDYLTKKLFGSSSEKTPADIPGQLTRIRNFRKKTAAGSHVHGRKKLPMRNFLKVSRFIRK